jgi:MFS family permease
LAPSATRVFPETTGGRRAPVSWAGLAALMAMFLAAAFQIGLYAYFDPLSMQAGLDQRTLDFAVTAVLAAQVAGSTCAAVASKRVQHFHVLIAWAVINLGLLSTLATMPKASIFIAAAALFGFVWLFFMPFQFPLTIDADPTRRAAVLLPGAQLLGGAVGPFLCSLAVTNTDVRGALAVCGVCALATVAISGALHFHRQRHLTLSADIP